MSTSLRWARGHHWPGGGARTHLTVVEGCEHLRGYLGSFAPQKLAAILLPTLLVIALAWFDPLVALVVVVGIAVVPLAPRLTRKVLGARAQEHWVRYEEYGARLSDSVAGLPTLATLGAVERRENSLATDADRLREATTRNMNVSLTTYIVTGAAMMMGAAGATVLAAWHAAEGSIAPGAVVLVLYLLAECFRPLQDLQNYWHEGFYGLQAARSVRALLDRKPAVTSSPTVTPVDLSGPPELRCEAVTFRYPEAQRDALRDVSVTIPAGKVTALVGTSGSGKTTLTSLLLRGVDPTEGRVFLQGRDLREVPLARVRTLGSRVSQDVVLLDGTVWENVECALRGADGFDGRIGPSGADGTDRADGP